MADQTPVRINSAMHCGRARKHALPKKDAPSPVWFICDRIYRIHVAPLVGAILRRLGLDAVGVQRVVLVVRLATLLTVA